MQNVRRQQQLLNPIGIFLLSIVLSATCAYAEGMPGREIMDEISRHHESRVEMESLAMILIDKKGRSTNRTLRQYSRKNEDGLNKYLLVFVLRIFL